MIRALLPLALCACTGSIPVHLAEWAEPNVPTDQQWQLLDEAGAILGYPIERTQHAHGSISLAIVAGIDDSVRGLELDPNGCDRTAIAEPDPLVIAHELAHALKLGHVCEYPDSPRYDGDDCTDEDEGNLMHPSALGDELTPRQERRLALALSALNSCL